jgi:hypothetical protein
MKSLLTTEKFEWLRSLGYTVTSTPDNTGAEAKHPDGITAMFTDTRWKVGPFELQGWKSLPIDKFQAIAESLGMLPLTEEEKARLSNMQLNYGMLNYLS